MPAGEFGKRLSKLQKDTPAETVGEVIRDQAYAEYQHEHPELNHPNGGEWKYQETALYVHHPEYVRKLAEGLLEGDLVERMATAMQMFGEDSGELTPKDFEILANSDRQRVKADGETVRDRPPDAPRLEGADGLGMRRTGVKGRYEERTGPNRQPPAGAKVTPKPRPY